MTTAPEKLHATEHPFIGVDISSADFWAKPFLERDETFAWLRHNAPVSWHPPLEVSGARNPDHYEAGFWAITLAEDINYVSQHHEIFSVAIASEVSTDPAIRGGANFLGMDPPRHGRYRNLISLAFTPKGVAKISSKIEERAQRIVSDVVGAGEVEFVRDVSSKLPMTTVADMVGVPESQVEAFTQAGNNVMTAAADPSDVPEGYTAVTYLLEQLSVLREIGMEIVNYRREHPADDIATAMALGEVEGRHLSEEDIVAILTLLSAAGNDTTRHTTSWTALALCQNPDQRRWLMDDYDGRIGQAVDEFIRYATVVTTFPRTTTRDVVLNGQDIPAGDKVAMFYNSGNRDETIFPDPNRFDLARPRANHVAFGGRGSVHYCLGNVVAKAQLRALFRHILNELPNLQLTGEPEFYKSNFINGIKRLPART